MVFQCPWLYNDTGKLPRDVVQSVAQVQQTGQFLFFGLTDHEDYASAYELDALKPVVTQYYEIMDDDEAVIREAYYDYGYRHTSQSASELFSAAKETESLL